MILYFDELDSTNAYCMREARKLDDRTLVVARAQSAGRGRRGRSWHSPARQNFYGSLLLKPPFGKARIEHLPQIAGLAVLDAVLDFDLQSAWLKWPNDVYVGTKKLAGILAECSVQGPGDEALVVGIGVNLNMGLDDFDRIDRPATSVRYETGRDVDLEPFAESLRAALLTWYDLAQDDPDELHRHWVESSPLIGKEVEIAATTDTYTGIVRAIEKDGAIVIELPDGRQERFHNGDVSLNAAP